MNEGDVHDEAQNEDKQSEGAAAARILDNWRHQEVDTG